MRENDSKFWGKGEMEKGLGIGCAMNSIEEKRKRRGMKAEKRNVQKRK